MKFTLGNSLISNIESLTQSIQNNAPGMEMLIIATLVMATSAIIHVGRSIYLKHMKK